MTALAYRQARLDDAGDIHALLLRLASEIPLLVDTLEREEALYTLVRNCARSGESWVAVDAGGHLVGFMLAAPNQLSRHYAEHEIMELHYAGVAPAWRGRGVFSRLIAQVLARLVPVTTTVSPQNRSQIADRLARLGFRPSEATGGGLRLRRDAGPPIVDGRACQ